MELVGQILGIVSFIIAFILYQMKDRKSLMLMQTLLVIVAAAHYFFLKAYPAMAMNLFAIVRNTVYYKNGIFKSRVWPWVMSVMMLVVGVLASTGVWSVLVITGLVINTYCLSFKEPQHFRISILVTSPLVLVYNIIILSIGGIMLEAVSIISSVIGLLRYSKQKKTDVPPIPSWGEIVDRMYGQGLDAFSDEVYGVIYSCDRAMRYVILKDEKGFYSYCLEAIYQFDEDEWRYVCESKDVPAMWEPHPEVKSSSLFDTKESALREMRAEPYYKNYFIKEC